MGSFLFQFSLVECLKTKPNNAKSSPSKSGGATVHRFEFSGLPQESYSTR